MENKILLTLITLLFYNLSFAQIEYTAIPDPNFEKALSAFDDIPEDGQVPTSRIRSLKELIVAPALPVINFTGLEAFEALEILQCNFSEAKELDVSKNSKLKKIECVAGKLEKLNVSNNLDLEELNCKGNKISKLDISLNSKLKFLWCGENNLRVLDISKNGLLQKLDCGTNQIENIDVSKNLELTLIGVNDNKIKELDISKNRKLKILACNSNSLRTLDISNNKLLKWLACQENELETLDLSNNLELSSVISSFNKLRWINAHFNFVFKLESFIATNNPELECILVNDPTAAENKTGIYKLWSKDDTTTYAENCGVLGTDDHTTNFQVEVFPNPSQGFVTISSRNRINMIHVFDINGRLIKTFNISTSDSNNINLSDASKGIYLLQIISQKGVEIRKVTIR